MKSEDYIKIESEYGANNYKPIPVVFSKAKGVWIWDPEGKKYLDCLSAYSAVNQGHLHPKILQAAKDQMERITLSSRAFYTDRLGPFLKKLCEVTGFEVALPMNTGAEAVETGIKIARRWGYQIKKVPKNSAEIIVAENNFHGRTTTIVGFSTDPVANTDFGPFTPGFKTVPYDDIKTLEETITPNTVAVLLEPIQGEAGVNVPSNGFLKQVREVCTKHNVLLMWDEIQTGWCRTGKMFAWEHENAKPDILLVGKALGGGLMPVSAAITRKEIMDVITPGSHGSTFGGNPLACAIAEAAIDVLIEEKLAENSAKLGEYFLNELKKITADNPKIKEVRGKGLFVAIEFHEKARHFTLKLRDNGILAKETHETTIRFAPPLVITKSEIDWVLDIIRKLLSN